MKAVFIFTMLFACHSYTFQPPHPQQQQLVAIKHGLKVYFTCKAIRCIEKDNFADFVTLLQQELPLIDPQENFCGNKNLLHFAAAHKRPTIIAYLISCGLDVNKVDRHGNGAIWHMFGQGSIYENAADYVASLAILINAGAKIEFAHCCIQQDYAKKIIRWGGCSNPGKDEIAPLLFDLLQFKKSKLE